MRRMLFLSLLLSLLACTPKATVPTVNTTPTKPVEKPITPDEVLSACPKFSDAPNPDQVEEDYVLYRDALKVKELDRAFGLWQKVYAVAPAADGKRNTVFSDGIFFYESFINQAQDSLKKEAYIDKIFELYDRLGECFPANGYADARKAFDYYYKYTNRKSKRAIYDLFKKSIDVAGINTNDFVINPFTALLVDLYFEGQVPLEEAKKYEQLIRSVIANGLATCKGVSCERWNIIQEYAPERLKAFESVKDFYDCTYYKAQYLKDFLGTTDCDTIRLVYSRLRWGGCADEDPAMQQVVEAGNKNCVEESGPTTAGKGYECLRNADYPCAVEQFKRAAEETSDSEKKGTYLLLVSKIYYAHLRNFSEARRWALQAAEARSNWGEPYIIIGKLYASSGPLCGPGRGWDSQIVTWVAIDMWNKAKSVDASVAKEANKNIANYTQYMPSIDDIFQRGYKEGQSFFVGCWIQQSTTIRAAPRN